VRSSATAILVEQPGLEHSGWFYPSSICAFITMASSDTPFFSADEANVQRAADNSNVLLISRFD